jgi:hypothetical protein
MLAAELSFICNRGIPIKSNNGHTRCFCSSSHYGDYCEFQVDLNLTKYDRSYTIISIPYSIISMYMCQWFLWWWLSISKACCSSTIWRVFFRNFSNNTPSMIIIKSYIEHHQLQGLVFHLVYSQQNSDKLKIREWMCSYSFTFWLQNSSK